MEKAGKMAVDLKEENPSFSKLLDVLEQKYLQDCALKSTSDKLRQVESKLRAVKQAYLEQLLFTSLLSEVLPGHTGQQPSAACLATAELQHCLSVAPGATLLGVEHSHLRAADPTQTIKSKKAVYRDIEQELQSKCQRVVQWHSPHKELGSGALQLARVGPLPQLLAQEREEVREAERGRQEAAREGRERINTKHKVLVERCTDLKHAIEQYKLVLTAKANRITLQHLQAQCAAMIGKLDVMDNQLLKGICSDGRLQALTQIRSQLLAAQSKLEEHLAQTQQTLGHYHSLGSEFSSLAEQYREVLREVENKQWALSELSKS